VSLDPDAKRFLDMAAAAGVRKTSELMPQEVRAAALQLSQMVGGRLAAVAAVDDGEWPSPGGPLPYRCYTPLNTTGGSSPGLIFFHGGGWVFGDLETHDAVCRTLSNAAGCRVLAIGYRLAPEHKFPAAVEDAHAAALWVTQRARVLGLDQERIAIGGDSAGANLAATVCQRARMMGPKLALQLLLCPVLDLGSDTPSRRAYGNGYFLDQATLAWTLQHYLPPGVERDDPRVSPLRASDVRGLPPTHIHTAEFDPLRDDGRAYAERLAREGVAVRYTCHRGMIHNFHGMAGIIPYARTALEAAGAAVKDALAQPQHAHVADPQLVNVAR
jgi:acetyl esterase/lipase